MKITDIIVIGAGIAGITSAIYLKRANSNFIILEGLLPGGMLNSLHDVENYPGFTKSNGKAIVLSLMEQIKALGISISYGFVQTILKDPYGFKVVTDNESYLTKAVIVASGYSMPSSSLKGEAKFVGRGVSYCATCDGNFFKDDVVTVYGYGDTASEEARYLANIVKELHFVCPEDKDISFKENNIIVHHNTINEIKGDDFGVSSIVLDDGSEIITHGVFPYVGSKKAGEFLNNLKPTMSGIFIKTDELMRSDIEGLFAAGDIREKSLRQLVTASSDGAIAAIEANKYVKKQST